MVPKAEKTSKKTARPLKLFVFAEFPEKSVPKKEPHKCYKSFFSVTKKMLQKKLLGYFGGHSHMSRMYVGNSRIWP